MTSERAPAKVNLCLFLGPTRADGRHELVTLFESVSLADELEIGRRGAGRGGVPGVAGPNLVSDALWALREAGWDAPPVRVEITKRIPVAAGLGGGSADAAAVLRLAPAPGARGAGDARADRRATGSRRARPAGPRPASRHRGRGDLAGAPDPPPTPW